MTFDPKSQFIRTQPAHAETLRGEVEKAYFQVACSFALAELAQRNPTAEQLAGASVFIDVLCNLGEKILPPTKLPTKRLETFEPKEEKK